MFAALQRHHCRTQLRAQNLPTCKGSGQVVEQMRTVFGNIQQAAICPTCHGSGKVPEKFALSAVVAVRSALRKPLNLRSRPA